MVKTPEVFITDGRWRKTLAFVRSLGKKNIKVTCSDSTVFSCSLFSKYCHKRIIYPPIKEKPEKFLDFLLSKLKDKKYGVLLIMEEETMKLIADNINLFPPHISIPVTDKNTIDIAMNKENIIKFSLKSGIPCPETHFITDLTQIKTIKNTLNYPVVIKPKISSGAKGVKYIEKEEDLEPEYRKVHNIFPFPLIQERIPPGGEAIGVSALFDRNSNLIASFTHKRIREYPVTGGASTLCESCLRPHISEMGIELLKKLNWYGLAMVEFKVDPRDNTAKLMEINARPWGSIQLAIYAGIDFPYLLYNIALNKKVSRVKNYKTGVKFRWLIPGDLLHFIFNPDRLNMKPGFFNFFDKNTTYAILSRDDFFPVIGKLSTGLTFLYDKEMRKSLFLKLGF